MKGIETLDDHGTELLDAGQAVALDARFAGRIPRSGIDAGGRITYTGVR